MNCSSFIPVSKPRCQTGQRRTVPYIRAGKRPLQTDTVRGVKLPRLEVRKVINKFHILYE